MRRLMLVAAAISLTVPWTTPSTPVTAAPAGAARGHPPLIWVSYWEDVSAIDDAGFSVFAYDDTQESFFLSDTQIQSFTAHRPSRRIVVDVSHTFGDLSGSVTVRYWGRRGKLERIGDLVCGSWKSSWKVLDPEPLRRRFERAGLSPIVPKGRGWIEGCLEVHDDGSFSWTATFHSDVHWARPPTRS